MREVKLSLLSVREFTSLEFRQRPEESGPVSPDRRKSRSFHPGFWSRWIETTQFTGRIYPGLR